MAAGATVTGISPAGTPARPLARTPRFSILIPPLLLLFLVTCAQQLALAWGQRRRALAYDIAY